MAAAGISAQDVFAVSQGPTAAKVALLVVSALGTLFLVKLLQFLVNFFRIQRGLAGAPCAPKGNWLLGHVIPLLQTAAQKRGAWDLMEDWLRSIGPIVRFRILGTHGIVVGDPQSMKRIFQTGQKLYMKDLDLSYNPFLPILGTGLVTADGDLWQKQRLLIGPALRTDILDDIIPIAKVAVDRLTAKLEQYRGTGEVVDIEEEFRLLTLQVIGEAVLSMAPEECDKVFPQLYLPVMEEANLRVLRPYRMYLPTPAWFQFRSRMSKLNSFLINYFRQRWQARQQDKEARKGDILDRILDSIEESGAKWDHTLEQQMCYEVKTFLLAGHETSAAMLTWSIHEMCESKECYDKVVEEAQEVFGSQEVIPSRRAVDGMTYTLSVLKEALRKYSIVPVVTRKVAEDDELQGHKVPKGTMVICHLQACHNMYKDPTAFKPDRFMPGGEYDQLPESDRLFMFLPFIQGPRNCLGQHFALLEARVVLSLVMKRFKIRAAKPGQGVRHPDVIPLGPVDGMKVLLD